MTTRNFLDATEQWLNESVGDPAQKARYEVAVIAEMQRTAGVINPQAFAGQYLDRDDRQPYIRHLTDRGVPVTEFVKNNLLVGPRLKRISMELESGLSILGRPDLFDDRVRMTELDTGMTRIEIVDRVKRMKGRG